MTTKTEYYLEIYEANDKSAIAESFQSDTPFMSVGVEDTIRGGSMNSTLRIKSVQHILWAIGESHVAHKVCVYTEPLK